MRLAGLSFEEIASKLKLAGGVEEARRLYSPAREPADGAAEAVRLELERVDRLHAALWARGLKADAKAVEQLLRLSARRMILVDRLAALEDEVGDSGGRGVAHVRPVKKMSGRFSKAASARETIAGFDHGMDIAGLTYGHFSFLDLIEATLEITGPADVVVGCWAAGFYDIKAVKAMVDEGRIRQVRFVLDSSSKRGQAEIQDVVGIFGEHALRTTRSHAKYALITNAEWSVCITTSMNLNKNPRCEQFDMTDDPARTELFMGFTDALFQDVPDGAARSWALPVVDSVDAVAPDFGIEIAPRIHTGRWMG